MTMLHQLPGRGAERETKIEWPHHVGRLESLGWDGCPSQGFRFFAPLRLRGSAFTSGTLRVEVTSREGDTETQIVQPSWAKLPLGPDLSADERRDAGGFGLLKIL